MSMVTVAMVALPITPTPAALPPPRHVSFFEFFASTPPQTSPKSSWFSPNNGRALEEVARQTAGLFQRSSSCVEGRNGRLSLQHHGQSRVSERRLKALTVIHNYLVKRADGTTAAERFFGQKHKDVFSWLLERLPDLPRAAEKRRKTATSGLQVAG